ncbi:Acyl-CoA-binding protein-like [Lachnellula arida]|uniref:Acyl-CoA-binding protein-like n=1 Tax=Lachnellula arida TaxID=1316785 RepID=A0A8T9BK36_9HELO|nr:Acyl-CoA-binding protein-like [Lachnellula arida]
MSAFDTAVADSKKLTSKPSNDELLELYGNPLPYPSQQNISDEVPGLYKVATGEDISKAEKPGMFDLKIRFWYFRLGWIGLDWVGLVGVGADGKAKKTAWQSKVDEGLTSDEAKEKYVALVESLKEKLGYDADKVPEAVGA